MQHRVAGDHSLKISAPRLLWFGRYLLLKINPQSMNELINEILNDGSVNHNKKSMPTAMFFFVALEDFFFAQKR